MAFSVSWIYQVIDKYSGPIQKIRQNTERVRKQIDRTGSRLSGFGSKVANAQAGVASFAGVLGGRALLDHFVGFEKSMNKLGAVSLANSETMAKFRAQAKELGKTTQFSASQAAQGMVFLKMAGLDANEVMKAMPGTLQLAAAGGIDLASAADIATNVLAQMGLRVKDLTRVNDVLATVQANANTNILEAAEAMKNVGTISSSLGVSIEQTTALIGAMANAGVKGGEAGTLLRNAMLRLVNPSKKAMKTFARLGIDMRKFVTPEGQIKNFTGLIDELGKRGASTAQIFTMFDERGGRAIQALQKSGRPALEALQRALEASGGAAEHMANVQMRGLPGVLLAMKSALEAVNIALFESGLDKILVDTFKKITTFARKMSQTNPQLLKIVGIIGALVVVLGPVLMLVGFMASGFGAIVSAASVLAPVLGGIITLIGAISAPIWLAVGAVAALVAGFVLIRKNWVQVVDVVGGTINEMVLMVERGIDKITGIIDKVGGWLSFGDAEINKNVTAKSTAQTAATLNGRITVQGEGGAKVKSAEVTTDMPGNLGFNMQ